MTKAKKYFIKTYGCLINYADSEKVKHILDSTGWLESPSEECADLIVINSCSVRQQAEDKVLGLGQIYKKRKKPPKQKILLTGCMAMRHDRGTKVKNYEKRLRTKMPWVDYVVDIRDIGGLPDILGEERSQHDSSLCDYHNMSSVNENSVHGLFPISTGCNNFCSYCIVPYARGELVNYEMSKIVNEVSSFIQSGGKLVTLLGQNVNSWKSADGKYKFHDLLGQIARVPGDFWINFLSSNPMDFTSELAEFICDEPKIQKWFNLAIQSGSDKILKKMNRKYSVEEYVEIANYLKKHCPELRLTTDIIVGFPGETEEDFNETLRLVKTLEFDMLYVGKYSPRPGTVAAKRFVDDVSRQQKVKREKELKKILNEMRLNHHKKLIGEKVRVLITGKDSGVSYQNHDVKFEKTVNKAKIGSFIDATVVEGSKSGLACRIK